MVILAAIAYLAGATIGLHLDIRLIITATIIVLLGCLAVALMGWTSLAETVFGTFATIAALQTGYVSVVVLNAIGMVGTNDTPRPPVVNSPSASDNPSHR